MVKAAVARTSSTLIVPAASISREHQRDGNHIGVPTFSKHRRLKAAKKNGEG
jgi:hypothetical protein